MKNQATFLLFLVLTGCSTSPKTKSDHYKNILTGFVVGSIVGSVNVPKGEKPAAHMALWGSATAALTGIYSVSKDSKEKEIERLRKSNLLLKESIVKGQQNTPGTIKSGMSMFMEKPIPKEFKKHVQPGRWEIYEAIIPDGEGTLVKGRQLRIIPPRIKSNF